MLTFGQELRVSLSLGTNNSEQGPAWDGEISEWPG